MKKTITLLLIALLSFTSLFALVSCQTRQGTDSRQTITIGLECEYAPYNWTQLDDSDGAVQIDGTDYYANGYDIKIAKFLAAALDRRLVVKKISWEGLIPAVQAGTIDMVIAGMSPTAERKESIDFSVSYYTSNLVVVVRKDGNFADAASLDDLKTANIVAQRGTFHGDALAQLRTVGNAQLYDSFVTMIVALGAQSIDGYIAEEPGAIADCNKNTDFKYVRLINNDTGFTIDDPSNVELAIGFKKNSQLLPAVNEILAGLPDELRLNLMENAISQQPVD